MPYPKRLRLHRMQVIFRRPNANERGPLGESYADIPWSASLEERADGRLILRLTSHTHPSHSDAGVVCRFPDATTADLMDLAWCSRETAHRRKYLARQINAAYNAKRAAMRAASGPGSRRSAHGRAGRGAMCTRDGAHVQPHSLMGALSLRGHCPQG